MTTTRVYISPCDPYNPIAYSKFYQLHQLLDMSTPLLLQPNNVNILPIIFPSMQWIPIIK